MTQVAGLVGAATANLLWGLSPLYYKQLGSVSPTLLLCMQVILTFALLAACQRFRMADFRLNAILPMAPTAALIGLNWAAYVTAVLQGQALQASYAYLLAPLLTVIIGAAVFKESMSPRQKLGIALAAVAVTGDFVMTGHLPFIGLLIAIPFATYIVLHKRLNVASPIGALKIETMLMTPFAVAGLTFMQPGGGFPPMELKTVALLALIGLVNALPLFLFVRSAPSLSASQLGVCQFIAPITSAILSEVAFGVGLDAGKYLVLGALTLGMACAVIPSKPLTVEES